MKNQLSFTTIGLVPALALLAFATVGQPPSLRSGETVRVRIADANDAPAKQIGCDNGVKGQYSNVHRGWVCSTELAPAPRP